MAPNVKAQGTLTIDTIPADGNTITIGATVYRFKDTMAQANDIKIESADLPGTLANLIATINGTGVAGTDYYAGTVTPHPLVTMSAFVSDDSIITANAYGLSGNAIATTETFTPSTDIFDAGTLGTTRAGAGWTAPVTITAITISVAASDNSFNDSGNGFGSLVVGQWIKASGFTAAADNGYFKIVTRTSAKITVSGGTLVDESAGTSRTIKQGSSITNGTTKTSFNIERTYEDLTTELALFVGQMINTFNLSISPNGIITGGFGFVGANESSETASGGSGYTAATVTEVMNAIDNVANIYEADSPVSISCLEFTLALNNNLRERLRIGTLGAFDIGTGRCDVSGVLTAYYENKTLYDKFLNFNTSSISLACQDIAGNGYVIDIPSIKVTEGNRNASAGLGDDFKLPAAFTAFMDAVEDIEISISKFAA
jgi:hypothetical protein